jgi:two-component system, chemotaxis family, chemotaxis protein CheY
MKFLIADDNELHRELITDTVKDHGMYHIVSDGNEAIKTFTASLDKKDSFSAIFIKSKIGSQDGPHALRKIREIEQENGLELNKEIPIIMTVMDDEEQISETYLRGNSTTFILKPLTKDKIVEELTLFGLIP